MYEFSAHPRVAARIARLPCSQVGDIRSANHALPSGETKTGLHGDHRADHACKHGQYVSLAPYAHRAGFDGQSRS